MTKFNSKNEKNHVVTERKAWKDWLPKIKLDLFCRHMTEKMNMKGQHVLVIGTENPWLEALILEAGARKVTTLGKSFILKES